VFPVEPVLVQTALLLVGGQVVLGVLGYWVPSGYPWLGLPLIVLFVWLITRTAQVVRQELKVTTKQQVTAAPWRIALTGLLAWQAPALLGLALLRWLPDWVVGVWHGTALPVVRSLDRWFPSLGAGFWFLAAASAAEAVLFGLIIGRPVSRAVAPASTAPGRARATVAAGQWAPARSHKDVVKRHKRVK
jgi:hypothetical protein